VGPRDNVVHLSFFKEAAHCSTLESPHPPPLSPKGARGEFEFIPLAPLGERVDRRRRFLQPGRAG
jgi:hypothetical protein